MKHLAPACFRAFVCAAGSCPDSCCRAGWEIVPDPETLALYDRLPGPEGERIRAGIVPGGEALLRQDENRVCVLLDPDGLCCVQRRFGHGALCRVCRDYPRFHREFGGLTEHGLSLSCPTAYALASAAPPAWEEWEDEAPPVLNELDPRAYLRLRDGRSAALELLAREELPLLLRLRLLRRLAVVMQAAPERRIRHHYELRLRRWASLPEIEKRRGKHETAPDPADREPQSPGADRPSAFHFQLRRLAERFLELEILSPAWEDALRRFSALAETGRLPSALPAPAAPEPYARWLWYELYKYWLDALDDGRLLPRVDRSLAMLLLGLAMDEALPDEGPFLRRISREIEHCEENLSALSERALPVEPLLRL